MHDPFVILGAKRTDDASTLKRLYRQKVLELHPDKGGDAAAFQAVHDAFETLTHPEKRRQQDFKSKGTAKERTRKSPIPASDGSLQFSDEDLQSCGFYLFLLLLYLVSALVSIILLAGRADRSERLAIFGKAHALMSLAPALAWAHGRRTAARMLHREAHASSFIGTTAWRQLVITQGVGTLSGAIVVGIGLLLAAGLRFAIGIFGGREFGNHICLFVLCVRKDPYPGPGPQPRDEQTTHETTMGGRQVGPTDYNVY